MILPTSWNSSGLIWDTSMHTAPINMAFQCICGSIKEACEISATTVPSWITADFNPLKTLYAYMLNATDIIAILIPRFANHTDNGGNWSGQLAIPNWTEETILAAIGDASMIVPSHPIDIYPWFIQAYKILNLLRWYNAKVISQFIPSYTTYYRNSKYGYAETKAEAYNNALAEYMNHPWNVLGSATDPAQCAAQAEWISSQGLWRCTVGGAYISGTRYISLTRKYVFSNPTNCDYDYQIYSHSTKSAGDSYYLAWPNLVENFLGILGEGSVVSGGAGENIAYPDNPPMPNNTVICHTSSTPYINCILKFDGLNGRKFRGDDW